MAPADIPFHSASPTSGFASTTPVEEPLSVDSSPQPPTTPAPLLGASQPPPRTAGAVLSQNAPSARANSTAASQSRSQAYGLGNGGHTPTIAHRSRPRPRQRGSRRSGSSRGTGFTQKEVKSVLNVIEKYLTLCREEWDMVAKEHGEIFFVENHTVDSIKRKFATLHRRKIPTGDPRMPDDVRRAKRLRFRMCERADIGEGAGAEETIGGILPSSDDEADDTMDADENELAAPNSPNVEHVPATPSNNLADSIDSPRPTMGVRPIVFKRSQARLSRTSRETEGDNFYQLFQMSLLQEQQRREEDMRCCREDREENRRRAQEEATRHQQLMEMMTMLVAQNARAKEL